jgi:hypothetical protein
MMFARRLLLPLLVAVACDDPDALESDDRVVARDALSALESTSSQLGLYDGLLGPVNLGGVALALAPMKVIEQVQSGLDTALADRACLKITSDKATFLDLRFIKCLYKGVYVHGRLRIELATETGDCDGEPCVIATEYTTTLTDLTIARSQIRSATSVLRIPEIKGEPRSYFAEVELTDTDERALHLRHELSWRRVQGCTHAELGARFTVDDRAIDVGAHDIEVCGDTCPRAGRVQIAWDSGRALAWEFDGSAEILVRGPRGREFVAEAPCVPAEP